MALTENGNMGTTMLVSPAGNNGGMGNTFGNDGWWLILLLLCFGGGWGNNGFANGYDNGLYPWMNQANLTSNGFQNQLMNDNITSIKDGVNNLSTQICGGFASVEQGANARQIANMQTAFNAQMATLQGFNGVQSQLCGLGADVARENCADRQALSEGVRDIIANQTAGTQRILDQMCQDKIDAKNDTIAQLRSELMYARGQASQDVQTAAIQAGQRALANEVEQYVAPRAVPAYVVQNPNCCQQNFGCGCNGGF